MLKSVTYVSRSMLSSRQRPIELEAVLSVARARNVALDVTGCLIASPCTFTQMLEGPAHAVDAVMTSIFRDRRHREVKMVSVEIDITRKFPEWTMAFAGHAKYIDRHIEILLASSFDATGYRGHVLQLQSLIEEFSKRCMGPSSG